MNYRRKSSNRQFVTEGIMIKKNTYTLLYNPRETKSIAKNEMYQYDSRPNSEQASIRKQRSLKKYSQSKHRISTIENQIKEALFERAELDRS